MATISEIETLLKQGLSKKEAADALGISKQLLYYHLDRSGKSELYKTPLQIALEHVPWTLTKEQKKASQYQRCVNHLEYVATGGKGMSAYKLTRLRKFYDQLSEFGLVVAFDPTLPAKPGNAHGGWDYVPRKSSDHDLIIRVNKYANMTDEGYELWRRPDRLPEA